jgi:hypothetical protein
VKLGRCTEIKLGRVPIMAASVDDVALVMSCCASMSLRETRHVQLEAQDGRKGRLFDSGDSKRCSEGSISAQPSFICKQLTASKMILLRPRGRA